MKFLRALPFFLVMVLAACSGDESAKPPVTDDSLPDLAVGSLVFAPANPAVDVPVTLTCTIRNTGDAAAGPFSVTISGAVAATADVSGLAAADSTVRTFTASFATAGSHAVTALVDPAGAVAEHDDTNNQLQRTVVAHEVADAKPDLVIAALTFAPAAPLVDDLVTLTCTVRNDGDAAAGEFAVQATGAFAGTADVPGLEPGASAARTFSATFATAGPKAVTVQADPAAAVVEHDDTNNWLQRTVVVSDPAAALPDLVVQDLVFAPADPLVGEQVTATCTFANVGDAAAGAFSVRLGGAVTASTDVPGLASGASAARTFAVAFAAAGSQAVTATVNASGAVAEPDYANNTLQRSVEVGEPPRNDLVVVDHHAVLDFDNGDIPRFWIEEVKRQGILIHIPGRSHAQQLVGDLDGSPIRHVGGLETLEDSDPTYNVEIRCDLADLPAAGALRIVKGQYDPDTGALISTYECRFDDAQSWTTEQGRTWTEATAARAAQAGDPLDASIYGWSYDILGTNLTHDEAGNLITFNAERRTAYLDATARFNTHPSGTAFVYATAPTDEGYAGNQNYLTTDGLRSTVFNQDFRDGAAAAGGYLFDQADIENWNSSFTERRVVTYNGQDLQLRHPDWDGADCAHGGMGVCVAKAKAIWWLAARLAGWDGTPACRSAADCGGSACVDGVCQ